MHRHRLPQRDSNQGYPLHPLGAWGFRGIAFNLSIYIEAHEEAGEDVGDMMALLPVLANRGRAFYDRAWYYVVASACDVWSQRTGLDLPEPVKVKVVRVDADTRGWKSPRRHLSVSD